MKPLQWNKFIKFASIFLITGISCASISITPEYDPTRQSSTSAIALSPSPYNQQEPAIDGSRVVWSEEIDGYWQVVLFDLTDNSRHQLTSEQLDHIYPSISGDNVVWWEGERGGADYVDGVNYVTGQALALPQGHVIRPKLGDSGLVWTGGIDLSSRSNSVIYFDLATQASRELSISVFANWAVVSGHTVIWEEKIIGSGDSDIWGYDLTSSQKFLVSDALGDQTWPDIYGDTIVWADNRNAGRQSTSHDIYGFDLKQQQEFVVSARGGDERDAKISGRVVVWSDFVGSTTDVYGYNLDSKTLFTIAADDRANGQPDISGSNVVWVQAERPNDHHAHLQIMLGTIPVQE